MPKDLSAVFRASVPEAAVDEDGYTLSGEYDIRASTNSGDWSKRYAVAKARCVQKTAYG